MMLSALIENMMQDLYALAVSVLFSSQGKNYRIILSFAKKDANIFLIYRKNDRNCKLKFCKRTLIGGKSNEND